MRYLYRPFDVRWLYWEPETKLVEEKRPDFKPHLFEGNVWLTSQRRARKKTWRPPQVTSVLGDFDVMDKGATYFPLYVSPDTLPSDLFVRTEGEDHLPNLSHAAREYLVALGLEAEAESLSTMLLPPSMLRPIRKPTRARSVKTGHASRFLLPPKPFACQQRSDVRWQPC